MVKVLRALETVEGQPERKAPVRESAVGSVVAGLRAAQLSEAELLAVVGVIHGQLAAAMTEKTSVVVTATAVHDGKALSLTANVESTACQMVAETVDLLVRTATPALWAQVRAVLEMTDEELVAREQERAYWAP